MRAVDSGASTSLSTRFRDELDLLLLSTVAADRPAAGGVNIPSSMVDSRVS